MARIVVTSTAYRGDVFPFVPIATELSRRGHDVSFVCPREYHPTFAGEPFRLVHCGSDALAPKSLAKRQDYVERWGMKMGGALLLRLYLYELLLPDVEGFYNALLAETEGADLLFCHAMGGPTTSSMVSEKLGVPWIAGDLFPMTRPTASRPPPGFPNLGPRANRALWRVGESKLGAPLTAEREMAAFRRSKGLDDTQRSPVTAMCSPFFNLDLTSRHYVPPEPDWTGERLMTGFSNWVGPDDGRVPDDVKAFLDAGEPPVLVTAGTSGATSELFDAALSELDRLGRRGLFLTSTDDIRDRLERQNTSGRHGIWSFVPLAGVLDRCSAIVQSGSHGTNALALTAGLPSVIIPTLFDQLWHAKRQQELGTGVHAKRPRDLPGALERLLADDAMRERAQSFGRKLKAEDGVGAAADALDDYLQRR